MIAKLQIVLLLCLQVADGMDYENNEVSEIANEFRQKRDYGGYGCSCGYNDCNEKHDKLLYFGAGVVLGIFLGRNTSMGRSLSYDYDYYYNSYNPHIGSPPTSIMSRLLQLPTYEIAAFALDLLQIHFQKGLMPNCTHRWICEVAKNHLHGGNFENVVSLILDTVASWVPIGIIQNRIRHLASMDALQWINCKMLSPYCKQTFIPH